MLPFGAGCDVHGEMFRFIHSLLFEKYIRYDLVQWKINIPQLLTFSFNSSLTNKSLLLLKHRFLKKLLVKILIKTINV